LLTTQLDAYLAVLLDRLELELEPELEDALEQSSKEEKKEWVLRYLLQPQTTSGRYPESIKKEKGCLLPHNS
jgi:hypothetical protein